MNKLALIRNKMTTQSTKFYSSGDCFDKNKVEEHRCFLRSLLEELELYNRQGEQYKDLKCILINAVTVLKISKGHKTYNEYVKSISKEGF